MCAVTSIVDRSVRTIGSIDGRYGGCWRRSSPKPPSHKPRRRLNSSSTPGPVDYARGVWRETLSWVSFGDNLLHFNEDGIASLCEGIYLHHLNSSYCSSGSGGMHGMWHNDKRFRMISGAATREPASINEARRRARRQYKNGGVVVRG